MAGGGQSAAAGVPLLEKSAGASRTQTLGNIIVSVVGTGVLGLPFALRIAGWLTGSLGVILTGLSTYYCMVLLVSSISLPCLLLSFVHSNSDFSVMVLVLDCAARLYI